MAKMRIEKVDGSLPTTLQPDTLYFVKVGSSVSTYMTDSTGATAYPTSNGSSSSDSLNPFLLMGAGDA